MTSSRLLPRLSVACSMAACVASGLSAARLATLLAITALSRCYSHDTYFVIVRTRLPLIGMAAAVVLAILLFVVERTMRSDDRRIHMIYWLALLGSLFALVICALPALNLAFAPDSVLVRCNS